MKIKKLLFSISLILNIGLICALIIIANPASYELDGTYIGTETNSSYVMSFDKEKSLYVLYKNGELVDVNSFKKSDNKNIYSLKGNSLNSFIINKENTFYFQVSEGEFVKFKWDCQGMSFFGEVPKEYKDDK